MGKRLRTGFDARMIEHSGIGRYIQELLPRLPGLGVDVVAWMWPEQVQDPRFDYPGVERLPATSKLFSIKEQWEFAVKAAPGRVDLLHVPHLNAPLLCRVPLVVTIHDLIPFHYPDAIASSLGRVYFHAMARMASWRARRVLTVSEHSRSDLIRLVKAAPAKVEAIHPGVDDRFARPVGEAERQGVRERFGLAGRYLLYTGQWKAYKNIALLLDVMERLDPEAFADVRLVLIGKEDPRVPMRAELARRGLQDRVVITGFVSDQELIALYQEATAFLFPSLYEGFGSPPAEAMAGGVPVIASNRASIPEVVGPGGLLLDPDRVLDWQQAVEALCTDPGRRQALSEAGRRRAPELSYDRTAERTVEAYRRSLTP